MDLFSSIAHGINLAKTSIPELNNILNTHNFHPDRLTDSRHQYIFTYPILSPTKNRLHTLAFYTLLTVSSSLNYRSGLVSTPTFIFRRTASNE